jgi:F-type H+-transporting ATPase subunit b
MRARLAAGALTSALACSGVLASGEGGGGASLIEPHIGTMFWTGLTFVILLVLLRRFAWKPLLGAIEDRERTIRTDLERAEEGRKDAEKLVEEHKALVAEARRDHSEAVAAGQRDAERLKEEILAEGRRQREQLLKQAEGQIEAEMRQARKELRSIAADLSIQVAEKLLARNLDEPTQRKLVDEYLAELEGMQGDGDTLPS